ncbi:Clp protease N-terminal domain-containing protein [Nocardiopsis metallicus]|uniref:ATP-dependent Clp protease ATP-binding subunit ClpA n=1 Tax=Nocardiopsis metallicus TaxID=179819 RepID=A0A840WHP7_9ACTN|nr:Clp protease N-terminal domain-containing protein [Nocardiopsis metallicus]MBB5491207.1 ATP-dependent Clp protease ATP-binding subunit ClpA [Nocardiopsis metallicus]
MAARTRTGLGQVYLDASTEALLRGDRKVGTEHVLLALLRDEGSAPARALGTGAGVDLASARRALEHLDGQALAALGITPHSPGPVLPGRASDRLSLTPAAKAVFKGLRAEAGKESIGLGHVLRGLLNRTRPDPVCALLDALDVDRDAIRARLEEQTR